MRENGNNRHKIGQVAQMLNVSVPTLRMYEREGILIPWKSSGGTRYFDDEDVQWIRCIRRMIVELGLNIEGIRRLLALIPCHEFRQCDEAQARHCPSYCGSSRPCWTNAGSSRRASPADCHDCPAYRNSIRCENLKGLFEVRLRQLAETDGAAAGQPAS
jgi:MerR family transcriptional regulator/heat shock protein HspR